MWHAQVRRDTDKVLVVEHEVYYYYYCYYYYLLQVGFHPVAVVLR